MADWKLDTTTGDLELDSNNDLILVTGVDAIAQDVTVRLKTFLGEWYLDTRVGMPYFEQLLGKKPRLGAVRSLFLEAIQQTPGIQTVNDLQVAFDGAARLLTVSFRADTTDGPLEYDEEFVLL
jgi:hypothetical protein